MLMEELSIHAADGTARARIFLPVVQSASGQRPGVVLFMDALGFRPAMEQMAERLSELGVLVLLPDLFYRAGDYQAIDVRATMANESARAAVFARARATTPDMMMRDTRAYLDALRSNGASGPLGVVGYCMGGTAAFRAAGTFGDRIALAASFHGGNLATLDERSPHHLASGIRARVYVGMAGEDTSFPPEQSTRLAEALRVAGVDHALENYVGCAHGWTVPDTPAFHPEGAERHWRRLALLIDEMSAGTDRPDAKPGS
ncbi:dienelactone hydrolase family protein [Rubellimicrobium arenae]|uniref:dienelactone hydrolase family protein n=1 Tax=Rubellimicrobium arenae TaxID=2817372 RepID=UPI001B30A36F|nr:dienelactone hydrolase family protein [Rubellimicrobium arenae]